VNQKRREQIEAAMMRHPSTYHARQRQSDPIDTAQEFHADPWWLSYSRSRKAKLFDALSVVVLVALIAAAGVLEWLILTGSWPR